MLRLACACVLMILVAAPAALADGNRSKILRECQNGALTGTYPAKDIRDARNNIPDDIDQYSDCRDVLSRALLAEAGGGGGNGGGSTGGGVGGSGGAGSGGGGGTAGGAAGGREVLTPSTDADQRALTDAAKAGDAPLAVDGRRIVPGAAGLASEAARNPIPAPLLAVLALLALATAAALVPAVRHAGVGSLLRRVIPGRSS